jgi:predicted acyltransferase
VTTAEPRVPQRLVSLDLFRGATVAAMIFVNNPGSWAHLLPPFAHAEWHGWTPTDLIFPFFLFIVGTAGVLSMGRRQERGATRGELAWHALSRGATIVLLGWLAAAYPFTWERIQHLRIPGVLPRIGLVYAIGTLLVLSCGRRRALGSALWAAGLLAVHTFLLQGLGHDLTREGNLQTAVDLALLKGHLWKPAWDPEGIVSTLSATATMLTGTLAGLLLVSSRGLRARTFLLGVTGAAGVAIGLLWEAAGLPINKGLWTGSYVLVSSGLAALVLALTIWAVDGLGVREPWSTLFLPFGRNPLLAFLLSGILAKTLGLVKVGGASLHVLLYRGGFSWIAPPELASHAFALANVVFWWIAMKICDRKGWYWKV